MWLVHFIEKFFQFFLPKSVRMSLSKIRISIYDFFGFLAIPYYYCISKRYNSIIKKVKGKQTVKVVFFVHQDAIWKYDSIFRCMQNHTRFHPVIAVIPYINYGFKNMLAEMNKTYNAFVNKGYETVKTYDEISQKWLNIKKELNPDLIFFTTPFRITKPQYLVNNFTDRLTVYVPYGFMCANIQSEQFNQALHNTVWRCFYETAVHKQLAQKYASNKGKNVVAAGYPDCDIFIDKNYIPVDNWKNKNPNIKRIIWAPHHTLEANAKLYCYSTFLRYYDFMFDLLEKYKGQLQIAFKPHPILKLKLFEHPDWGIEKTENYYKKWNNHPYGQLEESDYKDLFITSDAMIYDSISFLSEYCYTAKPALFLVNNNKVKEMFNEFGKQVFELSYMAYSEDDILNFIQQTVFDNINPLHEKRLNFVKQVLIPQGDKTATQNIIDYLVDTLKLQI